MYPTHSNREEPMKEGTNLWSTSLDRRLVGSQELRFSNLSLSPLCSALLVKSLLGLRTKQSRAPPPPKKKNNLLNFHWSISTVDFNWTSMFGHNCVQNNNQGLAKSPRPPGNLGLAPVFKRVTDKVTISHGKAWPYWSIFDWQAR